MTDRNNKSIYIKYEPEVRISQTSNNNNEISQVQTERPSKRAVEQNEIKTDPKPLFFSKKSTYSGSCQEQ